MALQQHIPATIHEKVMLITVEISFPKLQECLTKHRYTSQRSIKLMVYKTLLLPHFYYVHLVWVATGVVNKNKFQILQKNAVRLVGNVSYNYIYLRFTFQKIQRT